MLMTAAINATPGPVAPDYAQTRTAVAAAGHADSTRLDTSRSSDGRSSDGGPGDAAAPAGAGGKDDKLPQAVVSPTFRYDPQAQRMVMLMRDHTTGTVLVQVPSEVALRQYEQALKRVREEVAASQSATAGRSPVPQTSSIEAATLGVVIPAAAPAVTTDSGSGAGAPADAAGGSSTAGGPSKTAEAPAAVAGSVTVGAATRSGGARFNIVV